MKVDFISVVYGICVLTFGSLMLSACSVFVPAPVRDSFPDQPSIEQIKHDFERYKGSRIRLGGMIVRVENLKNDTVIEVVARELDNSARPMRWIASSGRFFAVFPGFADPAVYSIGRSLTVIGRIEKLVSAKLGEYQYDYPQIRVATHKLWAKTIIRPYHYDPLWYDLFWHDRYWHHPRYPFYSPWRFP